MPLKRPDRVYIEELATKHQLELFGIVKLGLEKEFLNFKSWIEKGFHAEMDFLNRFQHCREDPRNLLENSKSALIFGMPYYLGDKHLNNRNKDHAKVAQYSRFRDYHKTFKIKCRNFWLDFKKDFPGDADYRIVTDSAPLLERALASKTQLGFIGKNTLYIHPRKGSFYLISQIITTMEFDYDVRSDVNPNKRTEMGGCGTCKRCQINCPTGALDHEYQLDANKCIAYYTIEHRGLIPIKFWKGLKYYFFGCDICQLVCPYNRKSSVVKTSELRIKNLPPLRDISTMDQRQYETWFGGSPMTRAKKVGLQRNALISMCMNQDKGLSKVLDALENEENEVIKGTIGQIRTYLKERE